MLVSLRRTPNTPRPALVFGWNGRPAMAVSHRHGLLSGLGDYTQEEVDERAISFAAKIDELLPDDDLYAPSMLAYASTLANYWGPQVANDPRIKAALTRAAQRYSFVTSHYPGVTLLPMGATLPSGSSARSPILLMYADGSVGYAPGYGSVAQYGALQVPNANRPASDRVNPYTGAVVGVVGQGDAGAPLVGATPGSGTWDGNPATGPGYVENPPPPPGNYPGPITYTDPPAGGGSGGGSGNTGGGDALPVSGGVLLAAAAGLIGLILIGRK